ncbi:dTDP-4-dehydrorhamnose 3,5-epimerase [Nitrobacteraceae bacterium AZCC 2161]
MTVKMIMHIQPTEIAEILLLVPSKHEDGRGFFSETFRSDVFADFGIKGDFVQDNHVRSTQKGVVRGLHYQTPPHAQGKLIRCTRGAILDVAVDIRVGSPTFGRHVTAELSATNWCQLWVPPGFAHGYMTLEDDCEVIYKVTEYYAPDCDRGIAWDDPALGINWRSPPAEVVLSHKDRNQPLLQDAPPAFQFIR